MNKQLKQGVQNKGFSVVELLVYIAIMTLVLTSIVVLLVNATKILTRVKEIKEIRTSALVSFERMTREIKEAKSVTLAESALGTNPGSLTLQSSDDTGTPLEVKFALNDDGDLVLYYDGVSRGSLVSSDVSVDDIEFYRIDDSVSESVRIKLTLTHKDVPEKPETFYTTVLLRGSY